MIVIIDTNNIIKINIYQDYFLKNIPYLNII